MLTKKNTIITGSDRATIAADVKERYANGASIRTIARDLNRSYGFVHTILVEVGVKLRSRGGQVRAEDIPLKGSKSE